MNDQAILEQLALHPRSRAMQLADRVDMPMDDMQAALVALVAVGDVVVDNDMGPNGQPCHVYELSAGFIETARGQGITAKAAAIRFRRDHPTLDDVALAVAFVQERGTATSSELHALLELQPEQQASVILADAVTEQRLVKDGKNWTLGANAFRNDVAELPATAAPSAAPAAAPEIPRFLNVEKGSASPSAPAQPITKVERAIEYLRNGPATTGQLRVELGLRPGHHPSNFLARALVDGRIVREGELWSLGTGVATTSAPTAAPAPTTAPTAAPATAPARKNTGCRFAIWSDGVVEILKPSGTSLQLTLDETDELVDFLTKMGNA